MALLPTLCSEHLLACEMELAGVCPVQDTLTSAGLGVPTCLPLLGGLGLSPCPLDLLRCHTSNHSFPSECDSEAFPCCFSLSSPLTSRLSSILGVTDMLQGRTFSCLGFSLVSFSLDCRIGIFVSMQQVFSRHLIERIVHGVTFPVNFQTFSCYSLFVLRPRTAHLVGCWFCDFSLPTSFPQPLLRSTQLGAILTLALVKKPLLQKCLECAFSLLACSLGPYSAGSLSWFP